MKKDFKRWITFPLVFMSLLPSCQSKPNVAFERGALGPCPDSPNCVNSLNGQDGQAIEPLASNIPDIKKLLEGMSGVEIKVSKEEYIHAVFTTLLFRFKDDVEFYQPESGKDLVHVRSASRVGHSDLGTNRARIEKLRKLLSE